MKPLVEPIVLSSISLNPATSEPTDEERFRILDELNNAALRDSNLKTVPEIPNNVLNAEGVVDEFHAPRLLVKES
jgi:hypothetical protein